MAIYSWKATDDGGWEEKVKKYKKPVIFGVIALLLVVAAFT